MGVKILDWVEKIATGEKRRWFFAALIIIMVIGIIVFPYIDANFLYYNRIEKRIDILSNLVSLTDTPLVENEILYKEYLGILEEVETARENALFGSLRAEDTRSERIWKFAGGSLIWVFIAVVFFIFKKKGERRTFKQFINNLASVIGCFIVGLFFGLLAMCIPTIGTAEFNFVLAPIAEMVFLWLIIESTKSKSKED